MTYPPCSHFINDISPCQWLDFKALRLGLDTFQVLYARLPKVLARLSGRQLVRDLGVALAISWGYMGSR